ncbi:MAG: AAA family ATPase [Candidatus Brocadiae bacterium]|nr:AAA family ATPase [Candidatus Brocadiia bacterium]
MQNYIPGFVDERNREGKKSGSFRGTAMFVDISGFTPLTERAFKLGDSGAEVISRELTRLFDPMVDAVHTRGGFIAAFAGDAFMAVFPESGKDGPVIAGRARDAATEIMQFVKKRGTAKLGTRNIRFAVKCGLERGRVDWGIPVSADGRARTWYFRGEAIDGAAEAEHGAKKGQVRFGKGIAKLLKGKIPPGGAVADAGSPKMTKAVLDQFFASDIVEAGDRAELRHVVSCFMQFEGVKTHDQIQGVFRELVSGLATHGGVLNRIMFGDKAFSSLAFFGAPKAAEHAETSGVAFVQAFRASSLPKLKGVRARFGLDAGLCYTGPVGGSRRNEWSCLGDAVNTSARLMAAAAKNSTLVSPRVKQAAESAWEMTSRGKFKMKGKASRQEAFEPGSKRGSALGFTYRYPMLGRDQELAQLTAFVEPIFAATPEFVGVTRLLGEPGLGKTRLVAALRAKIEEGGKRFHWLHMPCDGVHKSGWNSVGTWLRNFFGVTDGMAQGPKKKAIEKRYAQYTDNPKVPEYTRGELKRTMSFAADMVECHWEGSPFEKLDDPKLRHENRIIAVKELVRALAAVAPVVIEVEDSHWLDASSAEWLTAMTRNIAALPLAIVATSRFADDGTRPALALARETKLVDLELQPIAGEEFTASMARALLGAGVVLDAEALRMITGKARGNPFYTEQLLLHVHDTGELVPAAAPEKAVVPKGDGTSTRVIRRMKLKSADTARLPGSLSSLVTARIDRLSPEVRETVKHASILGVRFLGRVLGELLKRSGAVKRSLDELLVEAGREGVIVPAGEGQESGRPG